MLKLFPRERGASLGAMNNKIERVFIIIIFSFLPCSVCLSQSDNQTESVKKGFEEAIKTIDAQKEQDNKKIAAGLQAKLDSAVQDWISQQKKKMSLELNTIIEQHWENLTEFGPRIHRNYYLREFSYTIINMDVLKSNSMIDPYKAVINLTEKLFTERYHSPDVTYPEDYYYTVTTPIKVNFEYYNDKFVVTGVEDSKGSIDQGWRREE
jgi:hypothetical protein